MPANSLPILPLRGSVLFPGVALPISLVRDSSRRAVERALREHDQRVLVLAQSRNGHQVSAIDLFKLGTVARLGPIEYQDAGVKVTLHGEERAACVAVHDRDGFLLGEWEPVDEEPWNGAGEDETGALVDEVRSEARRFALTRGLPDGLIERVIDVERDAGKLADVVSSILELPFAERQGLLENRSPADRLQQVLVYLGRQLEQIEARQKIRDRVNAQLGERQREALLREELLVIRRELGDEASEADQLASRLSALDLPAPVRAEVERELERLRRLGREAGEAQVIRNFLELVLELPWHPAKNDTLDLERAAHLLDAQHYGLRDVKERVLEFLAVHQLRSRRRARGRGAEPARAREAILLFIGPPGVGKTSVVRAIAEAMGRSYARIALGGVRDEADIRGHRRTYVGAQPGRLVQALRSAGTRNPVLLLDEIDKLSQSQSGDPGAALLEVLDPDQNEAFVDHFLGVPIDLSQVLFVATGNDSAGIPPALLDRFEMVEFSSYTESEKVEITRRHLLSAVLRDAALSEREVSISDEALRAIIRRYTREAGVRQLRQRLARVARRAAREIASRQRRRLRLTPATLETVLGRPVHSPNELMGEDQVGVATGMFYTAVGGGILLVEAVPMPGRGELVLTGQLGEVMRESARAAWSWARAHADQLGIDPDLFARDLHVHLPQGAVPKDGPSAGVTLATAIVSALAGRRVRRDLAMTGEITLTGRVLRVGGIREKVLGAVRAGVRRVVVPRDNEADVRELPAEALRGLKVTLVEELDLVLRVALRARARPAQRARARDTRPAPASRRRPRA